MSYIRQALFIYHFELSNFTAHWFVQELKSFLIRGNDGNGPCDMKDCSFGFSSADTYARYDGTLGDRMHYLPVRTTCKCN